MDECRKTFEEPKDLFLHITTHVSCYAPFALVIECLRGSWDLFFYNKRKFIQLSHLILLN